MLKKLYLPFLDPIMNVLLAFLSCLVHNNCVGKSDYIIITIWFILQLFFDVSWNNLCINNSHYTRQFGIQTTKSITIIIVFWIFQFWCRRMKLSLAHFFWIYSGIKEYWNLIPRLACNVDLKNMHVKIRVLSFFLATQDQEKTNVVALIVFLQKSKLFFVFIFLSLILHNPALYQNIYLILFLTHLECSVVHLYYSCKFEVNR